MNPNNNTPRHYRSPRLYDILNKSPTWRRHDIPEIKRRKMILKEHTRQCNENLIHNLSQNHLSQQEHDLLCKGLNFSPNIPQFKLQSKPTDVFFDVKRHIDIAMFFNENQNNNNHNQENQNGNNQQNKKPSSLPRKRKFDWNPRANNNETIQNFCEQLQNTQIAPIQQEARHHYHIMDPYNTLLHNNNIIIKKS